MTSLRWPLDSPVSVGAAACFLFLFLCGSAFALDPEWARGRVVSASADRADSVMGRTIMIVFGTLALATLLISWSRSSDDYYAFLSRAPPSKLNLR